MLIDLLAGTVRPPAPMPVTRPTILLIDSGLGGLTVLREVARARPDANVVYAADDAAFPYGDWSEGPLTTRVVAVVEGLLRQHRPDLVVIACNTISTLVLPVLRSRFNVPFVGTVPAVKPAVALSRTGRIAVLATPGTVRRDYTRGLVAAYAGSCQVDLVGSTRLAALAEAEFAGEPAPDSVIRAEIAPCFRDGEGRRTDVVVLACTHYPLLLERLRAVAPWPVTWIDPAPAIARRVTAILGEAPPDASLSRQDGPSTMLLFTGPGNLTPALRHALAARGLDETRTGIHPLAEPVPH
ncbi:glutamate racemase [uncultured Enterovirga sp.]|uniref:glutamate racemase n=1 Tax=uncultured Enterovirga sp. TaxID=2026352 RepID=UPI0035C96138